LPPRGPRLHGRDARRHQPRDHHRNDDERPARRLGGARRPAGVLHPGGGRRGARHRPAGAARLHRAAARPPGLTLRADVLTIFPELFGGILAVGPLKRARELGVLEVSLHQLRDYAGGRHLQVDDVPYGGGPGMVMKPQPLVAAIQHVAAVGKPRRLLLPARGARAPLPPPRRRAPASTSAGSTPWRASRACCWSAAATRASTSASRRTPTRSCRSATSS